MHIGSNGEGNGEARNRLDEDPDWPSWPEMRVKADQAAITARRIAAEEISQRTRADRISES